MKIFDEFIIVEEKAIAEFIDENISSIITSKLLSQFSALEFQINRHHLKITDISNASADVPLAQIIQWTKGTEKFETEILNLGCSTRTFYISRSSLSIVIRILKKRENTENPCLPLSSSDELMVHIGDNQIIVSAHWMMSVSPVINRMLSVEIQENQQRLLTLNALSVDMEQFMEFMEYVSLSALHQPILPNPKNVLMLLKFADYFQVGWLKSRCEMHLINCVEIPLIDRFLLIDHYRLDKLKYFFMHLGAEKLRSFYNAHQEQLSPAKGAVSDELLTDLFAWILIPSDSQQ